MRVCAAGRGRERSPGHVVDEVLRSVLRKEVRAELLVTVYSRPALLRGGSWRTTASVRQYHNLRFEFIHFIHRHP